VSAIDAARFLTDVNHLETDIQPSGGPRPRVVAPHDPAGPFEHQGQLVTLWEYAQGGLEQDPQAIGTSLRWCHDQLRRYPKRLPHLTTLFDEAITVLDHTGLDGSDRRLLQRGLAEATEAIKGHDEQPIHGDAGLGNVLAGPRWNDWEDACIGPVAWDLACLVTSARITGRRRDEAEAALQAHGGDLPDVFVKARGLQIVAWSGFAAARGLDTRLEQRLAWLRGQ
jgi:hypothetical protein